MSLSRFTARGVGTAATAINTAVPALKTWTVIGLSLCNKSAGTIAVDMYVTDSVPNNTYILKSFNIPPGETLFPWGQLGKGVLLTGDVIYILSNVAASVDVYMPYYQEAA